MKAGVFFLLLSILIACEYNDMQPAASFPVREIQTNLSTGDQVGIKTYTYEGGKLTREYFEANPQYALSYEILYEYDDAGNLIKESNHDLTKEVYDNVVESIYSVGLKRQERYFYQGQASNELRFFYTGIRLDSTQSYNYNQQTQEFDTYTNSVRYNYNNAGQLIGKRDALNTSFTYDDSGKVLSECEDWGDRTICPAIYEYDSQGRKTKWKSKLWQGEANEEEYFYEGNRLVEKRVWDYPNYGDINQPVVTKVSYQY